MSTDQTNVEAGEEPGRIIPGANKLHSSEYFEVTPTDLVACGYHFVLIDAVSPPNDGGLGKEWTVKELDGTALGVMFSLDCLKSHYYGVHRRPSLYVSVRRASASRLPFAKDQTGTLDLSGVAGLVDISHLPEPGPPMVLPPKPKSEQAPATPVDAVAITEARHGQNWRAKTRRAVGAVLVAALFLVPAALSTRSGDAVKMTNPRPAPTQEQKPIPPVIIYQPETQVQPPVIETTEEIRVLYPDYSAPTLWAMFSRVVGEENTKAEIDKRVAILTAKGYEVAFFTDPKNADRWWIITIVGPNGEVYESDSSVAMMLANAGKISKHTSGAHSRQYVQ